MKLIVQIPCFNEEETLAQTVEGIPRQIPGVDAVELLVIDDGSTDRTVEVAQQVGVDHVVRHRRRRGLARAFQTGLDTALALGADLIVNTDGDNQYPGSEITKLLAPLLAGEADIVIGDRQPRQLAHYTTTKKVLHALGSVAVRRLSHTDVPDAVSGFRALTREAALRINVTSSFSYTLDMVFQAGAKRLQVASVPILTNPQTRRSRLFGSVPEFVVRSAATVLRVYAMYRPLRVFFYLGALLLLAGAVPVVRFLAFYFQGQGAGHVQSLVLGGALITVGFLTLLIGLLADLVALNRRLLEQSLQRLRALELAIGERRPPDEES